MPEQFSLSFCWETVISIHDVLIHETVPFSLGILQAKDLQTSSKNPPWWAQLSLSSMSSLVPHSRKLVKTWSCLQAEKMPGFIVLPLCQPLASSSTTSTHGPTSSSSFASFSYKLCRWFHNFLFNSFADFVPESLPKIQSSRTSWLRH